MSQPPMSEPALIVEKAAGVAGITFNRPQQMNALDWSTVKSLGAAFRELEADQATRVLVLTGRGKAFSAGGDLEGYRSLYRRPDDFRRFLEDFFDVLQNLEKSRIVVIAAVNGYCLAGGLELMLACDLAVASTEARIGDAHLNFGQLPGAGGSQRLPRAIGAQRARDLMYTGRWVNGTEAERIGLVARVVPADELAPAVQALAEEILRKSPAGVAAAKRLLREGSQMSLENALRFEIDLVHEWATRHPDAMEGLEAFAAKRKPRFL
jgi:enoyl-CoA hydratase